MALNSKKDSKFEMFIIQNTRLYSQKWLFGLFFICFKNNTNEKQVVFND